MKRVIDIVGSFTLLMLLGPAMAVIAALIRLDSRGAAFFRQRRIGANGREFLMYKFRTMHVGTPDVATHLLQKPYRHITRVGRVLRRTSLDELPQLINVLLGDMSLVGPRPALFNQDDLMALRRVTGVWTLRPGITGWAQINGRDELSIEDKVRLDAYYVAHRTLLLDLWILLRTVLNVVASRGIRA